MTDYDLFQRVPGDSGDCCRDFCEAEVLVQLYRLDDGVITWGPYLCAVHFAMSAFGNDRIYA